MAHLRHSEGVCRTGSCTGRGDFSRALSARSRKSGTTSRPVPLAALMSATGWPSSRARAGMTEFSVSGSWLNAELSPADQARFFFEMDSLIPPEFVGYARYLL